MATKEPASPTASENGVTANPLWHPIVIVFVSNACIMVLELVAGRIIAPFVGVSLYTWTSVIGVVLAGISLGNYLGGWLADRRASLRLLGAIFLLGGVASLAILAAEKIGYKLPDWPVVVQILLMTVALFFLPSMILGGISPVVAKLAVRDLSRTGVTLGRIYAAGTVGSIVGTFATGFVLISMFGTHTIVWGVALILGALGAILIVGGGKSGADPAAVITALLLVLAAGAFVANRGVLASICVRETNYFCIRIQESEQQGETMQVLILDRLVHSYSSLTNPKKLIYTYEQLFAELTDYTFPRYMEATYPGSTLHVIEIDPGVTEIAYERLGLPRESSVVTYNEDARLFMTRRPTRTFDIVFGDAFNDFSVPYHLTTKEFNDAVYKWLTPGGLYLVNLIDGYRHDFVRSYAHTLQQTFRHVYVAPCSQNWQYDSRMTYVVVATDTPLDMDKLATVYTSFGRAQLADYLLDDRAYAGLLAEARPVLITDDFAPVDQMLAPMARNDQPRVTPTVTPPILW
jgi:MFS family permease